MNQEEKRISELEDDLVVANRKLELITLDRDRLKGGVFASANLVILEIDRMAWSLETFKDATPLSSLEKLREEVGEIEADIHSGKRRPSEYADALMCLFDSAGRQGIGPEEIIKAFGEKLKINKARSWNKNPDNTYSHIPANGN